jgi:iron(III) transport system ATP-binding protein
MGNTIEAAGVVIENLSLAFGTIEVLKGVNLEIEPGEFFAFLGPSGSGKSTLLRSIAGFGPTPKGRILIGGNDIAGLPPWSRDVGMVFQSYALWPHMNVTKNVAFGLEERKIARAEIKDRVSDALALVGLSEFADRRPSQLSGGQQQRVALARTIVVRPKVLLLDEPLSNLDANLRTQMRHEILELQRKLKLTTIFVTHDQEEANTMSERMAVLDQGIIQQVGPPMELYDKPANTFVAGFLGTANILDGTIKKKGRSQEFILPSGFSLPISGAQSGSGQIVIRPQNVVLNSVSTKKHSSSSVLEGVVTDMEFLGQTIRYQVLVGGADSLLVDETHRQGQRHFSTGDRVGIKIDATRTAVLNTASA